MSSSIEEDIQQDGFWKTVFSIPGICLAYLSLVLFAVGVFCVSAGWARALMETMIRSMYREWKNLDTVQQDSAAQRRMDRLKAMHAIPKTRRNRKPR